MQRDLTRLRGESHDVIVVGGGIQGACAAWEAARRNLKVALVEAGDFNQGTSSNSLRTLHGGLRHLQRLDFVHMRESIRERREWLRLAPELTRPLRFVLPASGGMKSPAILRTALRVNDAVSADRNEGVRPDHHLPDGAMLSASEFETLFPGLSIRDCHAAAAWYDGVCLDTERMQLAVITAAVTCGAQVANYLRVLRPLTDGYNIWGTHVRDELTGRQMDIHARVVINAAGPGIEEWLERNQRQQNPPAFRASRAFNFLARALPFRDALGLSTRSGTYFIMPWNGYSLVGTRHLRCDPACRSTEVSREELLEFLDELNPLLGEHRLSPTDVCGVFSGLLPETAGARGPGVALERAPRIIDHAEQGLRGLVSIVGVKWTTARSVGERVARMACGRLGRTEQQPGSARSLDGPGAAPRLDVDPMPALVDGGGPSRVDGAPALAARIVPDLPVVYGQIVHAVRHEMAMRLVDVVRRRTPLYLSAALDRAALAACAAVMARELRWSRRETLAEIDAAEVEIAAFRGPLQAQANSPRPVDAERAKPAQEEITYASPG